MTISLCKLLKFRIGLLAALMPFALPHSMKGDSRKFELSSATVQDINAAFDAGALTSERLVELYLARIKAYDQQGPGLNSIIYLNPAALEEARALDAERQESGPRSPLHGIPVVLKDLFDVEGMPTSGGFVGLADSLPWRDGWVGAKLRQAGAIVLAKTNMNDWFAQAGWANSTVQGQIRNPYAPEYTPGGSSGGSGAAVAAWFATVGFGSETGVSIRNPTSENNLVGLAPTHGLISRDGMIMSAFTHERGGPMTRNVYDLAATLTAVAGFDPNDLTTMASRGHVPEKGYLQFLDPQRGLHGARIGVLREMFRSGPAHDDALALIEQAIEDLKEAGATIHDPVLTGLPLLSILSETRVSAYEKRLSTNLYLTTLGPDAKYQSMTEMIEAHPDLLEHLRERDELDAIDFNLAYLSRLKNREMLQNALVQVMNDYRLDALVFPFKTLPAARIEDGWNNREADNPLSSQTGFPALLVPAGLTGDGLPIALEFLGRPFDEPVLIRLASAYEAVTGHRQDPPSTPPLDGEVFTY